MDILFLLRRNMRSKDKPATAYCRITIAGQRSGDFSTFVKVHPDEWDSKAQVIVSRRSEAKTDNETLNNIRTALKDIYNERIRKGLPVTAVLVKQEYLKLNNPATSFLEAFREMIDRKKVRNMAPATIKQNTAKYNNTVKFLESIGRVDLLPDEFDEKLADDMEVWLRKNLTKCGHDHAMKHLQLIKQVLKYCVRQKYIRSNPLLYLELNFEKPKFPVYLSDAELELLKNYRFANNSLQKVADIYLFCCYTGFAYVDYTLFHPDENIRIEEGMTYIFKTRQKSDELAVLPFFDEARRILEKYHGQLPKIANQTYNRFLKEIVQILGIRKKLTTHTARKTAAMKWLNAGVPDITVARMLGQSTTQNLKRYARILPKRIARDTEQLLG